MKHTFKKEQLIFVGILIIVIAAIFYTDYSRRSNEYNHFGDYLRSQVERVGVSPEQEERISDTRVAFVLDGDTFELENGERVRLVGIDAPEAGEPHFSSSRNALIALIDKKEVHLQQDVTNRDKYDRLLRLVWVEDTFVNLEMVRQGWASAHTFPPDVTHQEAFGAAEQTAVRARRGIWSPRPQPDGPIIVADFHPNAQGNDNHNLNDEYVVLKNNSRRSVTLTGWRLQDEQGAVFTFPTLSVASGATLTLYTGTGEANPNEHYWGQRDTAIWNNTGDTLYLYSAEGELILEYAY